MSAPAPAAPGQTPGWHAWVPEGSLALAVLVVGVAAAPGGGPYDDLVPMSLVAVATAVAVLLCRRAPGAALAVVWVTCVLQVLAGVPFSVVQAAVAAVAYGCARWGSALVVALSGISIPLAGIAGLLLVLEGSFTSFRRLDLARFLPVDSFPASNVLVLLAAVVGLALLAVPWLAGLAARSLVRARRSEVSQADAEAGAARAQREADQAHEIARLRDAQTRLAHDVHDVVGHSLAVILAQAESAQFVPDDDPARLKATLATIATSARSSLRDVRAVLRGDQPGTAAADPLQDLVDGVRATGRTVEAADVGTPQPLPPELGVVAHRVLQEMLTNAVKHGRRDAPVHLERHWPSGGLERDLRIEVVNVVVDEVDPPPSESETQPLRTADPAAGPPPAPSGQGLVGMQARLEAVGGRLDVRRRGDTFTTTAWLPVSGR